ncbi:hypothetical protein AT251_11915 [Enterovibrio nigricans]|nr:formyltransferase family protein [Enterovibrio nigricans]PKF50407.1 hypothetical protein AT251_11915 [Enterovibrio nigricans]
MMLQPFSTIKVIINLRCQTEQEKAKKDKLSERYSEDFVNSHYDAFLSDKKLPLELQHGYEEADEYFKDAMDYGDLSKDRIFYEDDINSIESIEKIAAYNPDVVVCHGGPLYTKEFIDAFKLVLNYHSGISPVYNGSDSHMFAFANGHPHLSGGTLMVMNPKIDGGDILAHYLPEIEDGDWPGRLFTKLIRNSKVI